MDNRTLPWLYVIAIVSFIVMGLVFHTTKYFEVSHDEIRTELSKEEFHLKSKKIFSTNGTRLIREDAFNFLIASIFSGLILAYGMVFMKMRRKNRLLILIIGISFVGCGTAGDKYKFEDEMIQCVKDEFNVIGFDIVREFDSFEKYLIKTSVLKDASGRSYYEFYDGLIKTNDIPLDGNYKVDSVVIDNYHLLKECYQSQRKNKSKEYLQSKSSKLQLVMDSLMKSNINDVSLVAKAVISVLDSGDFNNEFYKVFMLQSMYRIEMEEMERKKREALPKIVIQILENEIITLNGVEVKLKHLQEKINYEVNQFNDLEREVHIAKLEVEPHVKMGLVTQVKNMLREAGSLRLNYKSLEGRVSLEEKRMD